MQLADVYGNEIKDSAAASQVSVIAVAVAGTAVPLLLKSGESSTESTDGEAPPKAPMTPGRLIFAGMMERTGLYSLQVCHSIVFCTISNNSQLRSCISKQTYEFEMIFGAIN